MKKSLLVLAVLLIGNSGFDQSGAAESVMAVEKGLEEEYREISGNDQGEGNTDGINPAGEAIDSGMGDRTAQENRVLEVSGNDQGEIFEENTEDSVSSLDISGNDNFPEESLSVSGSDMAVKEVEGDVSCLQIPAKLDVVIDPWELDGRGQIYSPQYVIRNNGKVPGTLRLTNLVCQPGEGKELEVISSERAMSREMHEGEEKAIYMEIAFGNGDRVVLSREGAEYEVCLEPGGELILQFEGQVNESTEWRNGDVKVTATYFWEAEEELSREP